MSEVPCLRVPKILGEKAIAFVRRLGLFNSELKVELVGDFLYIPLIREPSPRQLERFGETLPEFTVSYHRFSKRERKPPKLIDVLGDRLPPHLLASLPHAIDFVGGLAILEIPPELEKYKRTIGEAILTVHKRVHTVLAKSGAVKGVHRLRSFEVIAGIGRTETVHKEHGCIYHVDVTKAYFSPRLSYEHDRVSSLVKEGETVVDMFAGVGPFSILIARRHRNVQVYAIDINPDAIHYLRKNIKENRVESKVTPILGEAKQIIKEKLMGIADRVIMNLPERAIEYIDAACETIKPGGGIIHYYEFSGGPNPLENAKNRLIEAVEQAGRVVEKVLLTRIVRAVAPFTWQTVVDAKIC